MKEKKIKNKIEMFFPLLVNKKIHKFYKKEHFYANKNSFIAYYYQNKIYNKYKCIISPYADLNEDIKFPHPLNIVIGDGVKIGKKATIYHNVTIGQNNGKYPIIGDNVIIYTGATIIGDIKIGDNVVIGANSLVNNDVPNNCVVVGNPAKIIKRKVKNEN